MSVLRVKYRSAAIQPSLSAPRAENDITAVKKPKIVEEDPYAFEVRERMEAPPMHPYHTQNRRVVAVVESDEAAVRREQYPTLVQRVDITKNFLKQQKKEQKMARDREKARLKMEQELKDALMASKTTKAMTAEEEIEASKKGKEDENDETKSVADSIAESEAMSEDEVEQQDQQQDHLDADHEKMTSDEDALFKEQMEAIREKKFITLRDTKVYHRPCSNYQRRNHIWSVYMGWGNKERKFTEIMPWMIIGQGSMADDMHFLVKMRVTHILNVTTEMPNKFPDNFIYLKIPIRDEYEEDLGVHFDKIISWLKNVQDKKGKVYIHCSAGASRAPASAMAFLISERKIPLADAFNYIQARRPLVNVNKHFLFQLAELEVKLLGGSSVSQHQNWEFYEYNILRAEDHEKLPIIGIMKTCSILYKKYSED